MNAYFQTFRSVLRLFAPCICLLAIPCMAPAHAQVSAPVLAATYSGVLKGAHAGGVRAFKGVPYAAPPIGDKRWKAPQPVRPWAGIRDATTFASACPQPNTIITPSPSEQEDCLYLNVYAPQGVTPASRLPVMVWLHGGSYMYGTGSIYDASELARSGQVVVVTVNYRLGALGFLALPQLKAENPALSFGLQDQQAALKWVHSNISAFGGDKDRVTLFGESAGAASTCVHLASPSASGLFHRAIIQSGACDASWAAIPLAKAYDTGRDFAQQMGCTDEGSVLACLRSKSTADLLRFVPRAADANPGDPSAALPWIGVIDGVLIPDMPLNIVKAGQAAKVPVMLGTNQNEGGLYVAWEFDVPQGSPMTEAQYEDKLLSYGQNPSGAAILKSIYSLKAYGTPNRAIGGMLTDLLFSCEANKMARAFANSGVAVYTYEFHDPHPPSLLTVPVSDMGAYHAAETQFLFDLGTAGQFTTEQKQLRNQMIGYWSNFAAAGQPNGANHPQWPRFNGFTTSYRQLQPGGLPGVLSFGRFQAEHHCLFWNVLTSLVPPVQ